MVAMPIGMSERSCFCWWAGTERPGRFRARWDEDDRAIVKEARLLRPGQIGEDDRKNMLRGLNGLKNPVGQRRIQSDDQQGIPAPFFTGTLHAGDINLV